ncbi:inorganic phosphate transporter, partial [Patescibacteria group bacterium]|nr:inorganic phosphate transporter [Patescibacteria group bacterium]
GGWRIVKTMGTKIIHLRPFEGFCAETAGAVTLFISSTFGIPVSTTHVISGSIMGVGAVKNYKQVKWITTRKIFLAWILTIPAAMIFGGIFSLIIR